MAGPRDDHGIAGLNAMIMFIALTLAGSIIATIIIASMVEVMRESKSDAQKSQFALYGKVMVIDAHITKIEKSGDEIEEALISVTIELSPGSTTLQDQQLLWTVICPNEVDAGDPRWSNNGNFGSATDMTGNGNNPSSVDVIEPGKTYKLLIHLFHDNGNNANGDASMDGTGGCPPNTGEKHSLLFTFEGSGLTSFWELNYGVNIREGDQLI